MTLGTGMACTCCCMCARTAASKQAVSVSKRKEKQWQTAHSNGCRGRPFAICQGHVRVCVEYDAVGASSRTGVCRVQLTRLTVLCQMDRAAAMNEWQRPSWRMAWPQACTSVTHPSLGTCIRLASPPLRSSRTTSCIGMHAWVGDACAIPSVQKVWRNSWLTNHLLPVRHPPSSIPPWGDLLPKGKERKVHSRLRREHAARVHAWKCLKCQRRRQRYFPSAQPASCTEGRCKRLGLDGGLWSYGTRLLACHALSCPHACHHHMCMTGKKRHMVGARPGGAHRYSLYICTLRRCTRCSTRILWRRSQG